MPANQTNELVHLWAAMYGGVGHLYTPARTERTRPWLPYVLDNGRYSQAVNNLEFDPDEFKQFLDRYSNLAQLPLWMVVPDVPFNAELTRAWWGEWEPYMRQFGIPLALAVQDGMTTHDLALLRPGDVLFIGGSDDFKWGTLEMWCAAWDRIHLARMNRQGQLDRVASLGVESCDGSGWFRGKAPQVVGLGRFLAKQAGKDPNYAEQCALATRYAHRDQLSMERLLREAA